MCNQESLESCRNELIYLKSYRQQLEEENNRLTQRYEGSMIESEGETKKLEIDKNRLETEIENLGDVISNLELENAKLKATLDGLKKQNKNSETFCKMLFILTMRNN